MTVSVRASSEANRVKRGRSLETPTSRTSKPFLAAAAPDVGSLFSAPGGGYFKRRLRLMLLLLILSSRGNFQLKNCSILVLAKRQKKSALFPDEKFIYFIKTILNLSCFNKRKHSVHFRSSFNVNFCPFSCI